MHEPGSLTLETCWESGGRLRLDVLDDGRVQLAGTSAGFVGLARMLLFAAQHGLPEGMPYALDGVDAIDAGTPMLELAEL